MSGRDPVCTLKLASSAKPERDHALDAARGVLMMLGVLLHASNVYSTAGDWIIADGQRGQFFSFFSQAVHVFRMPAFFWISGYFCALKYASTGSHGLLHKRLQRLLIPLLSTWLTFNVAQLLLVAGHNGEGWLDALRTGVPLYHLWFLIDLIVFQLLAVWLLPQLYRLDGLVRHLETAPTVMTVVALTLLSVFTSMAARATGIAYDSILGMTSLYRLASDFPFFIVGILMCVNSEWRRHFLRLPLAPALAALPLAIYAEWLTRDHSMVIAETALVIKSMAVWVCAAAVLRLFDENVRVGSRLTRFLSETAYSVYLFHHLFVIFVGLLLIDLSIGAWPKFMIVVLASMTVSIMIHVGIIRRSRVARLLFNGK